METTEPFPAGTQVEIIVHTHDVKLRVTGVVQSMHPAFGMGIKFNVATEIEEQNVRQLVECAAAAAQDPA